jgi:hypothetical protein
VLATGRYLGEGFDDASLDTLFLTMPISWKGTLAQYPSGAHILPSRPAGITALARSGGQGGRASATEGSALMTASTTAHWGGTGRGRSTVILLRAGRPAPPLEIQITRFRGIWPR